MLHKPSYDELAHMVSELTAQHDRDVARVIALLDALEDMCNQYLDDGDGFNHVCMSAGEGVEHLFFEWGILKELHNGARFGIVDNWREIVAQRNLPDDTGARTFQQRLSIDVILENYALKERIKALDPTAENPYEPVTYPTIFNQDKENGEA